MPLKSIKTKRHKTSILYVVLHEGYLLAHTKRGLRVEDRTLRKTYRKKREKMTGSWSRLHNERLNDFRSLPNAVRLMKSRRIKKDFYHVKGE